MVRLMCGLTKEKLAQLLKEAERAHAEYEKKLGKRDENWPEWYAEYIIEKLKKEKINQKDLL
ncbi:hypothetical protein K1720_04905 [Thermococcus argininiproducens]|uniref:Uncharacterized protein n=1 Tax=Thermococcus argininiproducens TaxID=2866384 RepID=A0A9E7MBW7_9EURY|nr:hypothetical protein [Thermococcus argininiproducens]USH00771.1 hypothetical protein K1720_04905 [Thermococcus argininiproducens]